MCCSFYGHSSCCSELSEFHLHFFMLDASIRKLIILLSIHYGTDAQPIFSIFCAVAIYYCIECRVVARQHSKQTTSRWCIINYYTNRGSVTFECISIFYFVFANVRATARRRFTAKWRWTCGDRMATSHAVVRNNKTGDNNPHSHTRRRSQFCNAVCWNSELVFRIFFVQRQSFILFYLIHKFTLHGNAGGVISLFVDDYAHGAGFAFNYSRCENFIKLLVSNDKYYCALCNRQGYLRLRQIHRPRF